MRRSWSIDDRDRPVGPGSVDPSGPPRPFGTSATVAWITEGTISDGTITTAIPPLFPAYATVVEPDQGDPVDLHDHERALIAHLARYGTTQWWLGYLDTGVHDVVLPDAERVPMYWDWPYVLVQAGPVEALTWRHALPDLIFPLDRSWLFSMLWDDGWTDVGGPRALLDALATDPLINARLVQLGEDPTPPGQTSS